MPAMKDPAEPVGGKERRPHLPLLEQQLECLAAAAAAGQLSVSAGRACQFPSHTIPYGKTVNLFA